MKRGNRPTLRPISLLTVCCFFITFLISGCGIEALSGISGIGYEDDVQKLTETELSLPNAISDVALHYGKLLMRYRCLTDVSDIGAIWAMEVPLLCLHPDEHVEFIPTGTIETYSSAKPTDIMILYSGCSCFVDFDRDTYGISEEDYNDFLRNEVKYSSSDHNVVDVYGGRILANGGGTAIVTVQYQDMVQCLRVTVGRKNFVELMRSEVTDYDDMAESTEDENVIHMSSANTGLDLENRYIMTGKEVEVRDRPRQSGYVLRTLSYQVVDVSAATYDYEGDIWVIVSFFCFDSASDNMGWVKLTDLMEYTEENYQLLRYPVKVREGCVDLETGEPVEWDAFAVDYVDGYAIVGREGGRSYKVSPSDIIYPEFYNNSPYNFPTFSDK